MIDTKMLLGVSSAEKGLEESLKAIMPLELETFDFIGTPDIGFTLTHRGRNNINKLSSFITMDYNRFIEPIKNPMECMMYFSSKKLEIRQMIEQNLTMHKESRENSIAEANKSGGIQFPPAFTEGLGDDEK